MKIKRYFAADMRQAIRLVREEQGPDAVILSNRKVDGGVEVVAALDYDEGLVRRMAGEDAEPRQATVPQAAVAPHGAAEPQAEAPALRVGSVPPSPESLKRGLAEAAARPPQRAAKGKPKNKTEIVWSQDPALVAMRAEIKTLRGMLEGQLSGLAWGELGRRNPLRVRLLEQLTRLGLSPALCDELANRVRYSSDTEHNWRYSLGLLAQRVSVTDDDILSQGGVVALVGPTGVGKTTTAAKLAARFTLRHGPNRVALVTTDSYRIGAHQQLRTYGKILGAPVHVAGDAEELQKVLASLREKTLVLIDTAGMSQRDMRLSEQFAMLKAGSSLVRNYLVLSATTQRAALEETIRAFSHLPLEGGILTKIDESVGLGEALSAIVQQRLPLAYVGDGQRVPEDLHPARANTLVSRSVALMQKHSEVPSEETMAFSFGGMVSNGSA